MRDIIESVLDKELEAIRTHYKREPFSRDFVFENDPNVTRLRNKHVFPGPHGPKTLLSIMLRFGLDEHRRSVLFSSPFDLGSLKTISKSRLSLTYLAEKVRKERKLPDHISTRKGHFESITDAFKSITGRRYSDYEDKQNTLRVIYLFDRLLRAPEDSKEGRNGRILTFIKTPANSFSFEARGSYPTTDSEENTLLLNDLRSYVSIDIDLQTLDRIDSFFHTLIDRIDEARAHMDVAAHARQTHQGIAHGYRGLLAQVDRICDTTASESLNPRLDHDIYVHLHRIEAMHFLGALQCIYEKSRPPSPLVSIREGMIRTLSELTTGKPSYLAITLHGFKLDSFRIIVSTHKEVFLQLISTAMGETLHDADYVKATTLADELLYRVKLFAVGAPIPRSSINVSFREMVSALCAVVQALKYRTLYRPKIFRDTSQPRSIITPLEKPLDLDDFTAANEIQEGYIQIWHHRREWVQAALEGTLDVAELMFELRTKVLTRAMQCLRSNDFGAIEAAFSAFETGLAVLTLPQRP